jgi:hypothetical protein
MVLGGLQPLPITLPLAAFGVYEGPSRPPTIHSMAHPHERELACALSERGSSNLPRSVITVFRCEINYFLVLLPYNNMYYDITNMVVFFKNSKN